MNAMVRCIGLTGVLAIGLSAGTVYGALLAYDGFNYVGTAIDGQSVGGSTGFDAPWSDDNGDVSLSNDGVSLVPSASPFPPSGGRTSVGAVGTGGDRYASRSLDSGGFFDFSQEGVAYVSLLMRKNSISSPSAETVNFYGTTDTGGSLFRIAIGSPDQFFMIVGNGALTSGGATVVAGDTYFAVAKVVAHASTPDEVFLKTYSPGDTVGTVEPTSWDVAATGSTSGELARLGIAFGRNADAGIDEIRYGNRWVDVAVIPEPTSLTVFVGFGGVMALIVSRRRRRA